MTADLQAMDIDTLDGDALEQAVWELYKAQGAPAVSLGSRFILSWAMLCESPTGWIVRIERDFNCRWRAEYGLFFSTGPTPEIAMARVLLKAKRAEKG